MNSTQRQTHLQDSGQEKKWISFLALKMIADKVRANFDGKDIYLRSLELIKEFQREFPGCSPTTREIAQIIDFYLGRTEGDRPRTSSRTAQVHLNELEKRGLIVRLASEISGSISAPRIVVLSKERAQVIKGVIDEVAHFDNSDEVLINATSVSGNTVAPGTSMFFMRTEKIGLSEGDMVAVYIEKTGDKQ